MDKDRADVVEVARFILGELGPMTTMKLQKLVYYAQAWALAWDGEPLFSEPVEAWERGPVVRTLFDCHKGQRWIRRLDGDASFHFRPQQRETIQAVLERYGHLAPEVLSELTHAESPWRDARNGHSGWSQVIKNETLREYYRDLMVDLTDPEDLAEDGEGSLFWLKTQLARLTSDAARHPEWDMGTPQGREVW